MCQCGCGDFQADFWYRLPDDNQMAVEIYDGCGNCKNPATVTLHLFSQEEAETWQFGDEEVKPLYDSGDDEYKMINFPVVGPEDLIYALEHIQEDYPDADLEEYGEDFADLLKDYGYELLHIAVHHCIDRMSK